MQNITDEVTVALEGQGPRGRLSEIAQTKAVKFGLLVKDGDTPRKFKTFHPMIKCRDYFSDILHYKAVQKSFEIYGLALTPETNVVELDVTRLLIQLPDGEHAHKFIQNFPFIQHCESKYFGIGAAKLFAVAGNPNRVVLETDRFWQKSTQLISFLTLLCRVSLYMETPDQDWLSLTVDGVDGGYIKKLDKFGFRDKLPLMQKMDYDHSPTPSGFPANIDSYTVHDCGGILSFGCLGQQWKEAYGYSNDMSNNYFVKQMSKLMNA